MPFSPDPYAALRSAARYVRQFRRKTFVLLVDGPTLGDARLRRAVCEQIALLWTFSIQPVVVHGAGPELNTPFDAMSAKVRMDLLADLQAAGVPCVGLSGVDAGLLKARRRNGEPGTEPSCGVQQGGQLQPRGRHRVRGHAAAPAPAHRGLRAGGGAAGG